MQPNMHLSILQKFIKTTHAKHAYFEESGPRRQTTSVTPQVFRNVAQADPVGGLTLFQLITVNL